MFGVNKKIIKFTKINMKRAFVWDYFLCALPFLWNGYFNYNLVCSVEL